MTDTLLDRYMCLVRTKVDAQNAKLSDNQARKLAEAAGATVPTFKEQS